MRVYSLVDKEFGEVEYTSIDREVIEEIMMDNFMLDYQQQCQADVDNHYANMEESDKETYQIMKQNWDMLIRWYDNYYEISENILI